MNLRIALCLSGQPRGVPKSCEFVLQNLIQPNNITDIFMHTWYSENQTFDSSLGGNVGTWNSEADKIIIEQIKPKKIIFEEPNDFDQFKHLSNQPTAIQTRIASQFYSIQQANNLKKQYELENNFKYDIVIKTRLDLEYHHPVIIKNLISDLTNTLYVAEMYQHTRHHDSYPTTDGQKYSSMSDTFVMGSSENIDILSDMYNSFETMHAKIWPTVYVEAYLGYHCRLLNKMKVAGCDIKYNIYRK